MIFRLTVPIPNNNAETVHNEHFYFDTKLSPTKEQILSSLYRQKGQIYNGGLVYNGNKILETLDITIQQLENISSREFPEVNAIGYTSYCWIETRYGKRKMFLTIILPMRL